MEEKILTGKKHGMAALLGIIVLFMLALAGIIFGAVMIENDENPVLFISGMALVVLASILCGGLKVLKPQEALVLTLFGNYVGTLKEAGFYYVNPFCSSVNPAARTRLSQSGDVSDSTAMLAIAAGKAAGAGAETASKKISLKVMTLNNSKQKINDCLGNPIEIGIAVTWRVVNTAKAVFEVDNYKEFLSLQCDSALRDIVRIYPYDVAPNVDTTGDAVCAVPAKSLRRGFGMKFRIELKRPAWKSSRRESLTLPMRRKLRRLCCKGSRHLPSLMRER